MSHEKLSKNRLVRAVWSIVGFVSLSLGLLGVVLPILPTTPFVLLAAFAFAKSVPGLREWLENHRVFGKMIADWEATGAIAPRYKTIACFMMALAFLGSIIAGFSVLILSIQFVCLGGSAIFVLSRPNGPKNTETPS